MIRMIDKKIINDLFWGIFLGGIILLSVIGCAVSRTVLDNTSLSYYLNYLCWIALGIACVTKGKKILLDKQYIFICAIVLVNTVIGAFFGRICLQIRFENLHQGVLNSIAILIVMGIEWNDYVKKEDAVLIMRTIFGIGIIISLYAMVIQNQNWIGVLRGLDRSLNSWKYTSFFGQRNVFAYFCFLSSVAGKYLFDITKKKKYIIGIVLFALQIYITNSRNAILSLFLFYAICAYSQCSKRTRIILLTVAVCIGLGTIFFMDTDTLLGRFYHGTKSSYGDSGVLRLAMWYFGIKYLISNNAVLTGLGYGSQTIYLTPLFDLGSFHNVYMDVLFQGGIILLGIYVYMIVKVIKSILAQGNQICKKTLLAFVIAYLVNSLFDSFSMLFSSNYAGIPTTIMICILARVEIQNSQ